MDNEATKILNPDQNATQGQPVANNLQEEKKEGNAAKTKSDKGSTFFARTAATAAGAALGTSAAMAAEHIIEASMDASDEVDAAMAEEEQVQAVAAETETNPESAPQQKTEVAQETATASAATAQVQEAAGTSVPPVQETVTNQAYSTTQITGTVPSEHDAIVATDEGLRVAQVDDSLSFSQAFAEARSQVGAGGVFEWNGKVYSTYYAEEWDGMSASERSEWQARVDYGDVIDASEPSGNATSPASQNDNLMAEIAPDSTYIDNSAPQQATAQVADDNEVHVVGVAVLDNGQGGVATLAGLQSGDEMAILVDVDTDGTIDLLLSDANDDGQLGADEVYQITETSSGYGLAPMDEAGVDDNMYMASNDDMPDYMNDADAGFMDA